jgi:Tol biopolymer transport system component
MQHPLRRFTKPFALVIGLVLLTCCAGVWFTLLRPHPVFPAIPGTSAIAFETERDGGRQIYIMRADGTALTRLTYNIQRKSPWPWYLLNPWRDLVLNQYPMPTPDGTAIRFLSEFEGDYRFYQITLDGAQQTALPVPNQVLGDLNAAFAPDGTQIAFVVQQYKLAVITSDGANERCLTCMTSGRVMDLAWSPDGQHIAFSLNNDHGSNIYRINADGSGFHQLTHTLDGFNVDAAWSPDGQRIAFRSKQANHTIEIYTMNADGSAQIQVTHNRSIEVDPAWSPDGQWIAFSSNGQGDHADIYRIRIDGTQETQLTFGKENNIHPTWVRIPTAP